MPTLKEVVPQDLHDREYLKPLLGLEQTPETFAQVFKKLDGAESLLGKRPAIPGKDAKDEDFDKFFEQFRPEKPEDYVIPISEGATADQGFLKAVRQAFHAGKISRVQASGFLKAMTEHGAAVQKAAQEAQKKKDLEFDALAKAALGEQNKPVMERVKKLIKENAPAAVQDQLERLDDKNLVLMAGVIDSIIKKYVPEDKLNGKGPDGSGGSGAKDKREEAKKLMASKAYTNWQDPEHESTVAKVNELYKEIAAAGA